MNTTRAKPLPPIRVRREPPTIEEAVAAARDLTADPAQQAEIAAGLMGVSPEDIPPRLIAAALTAPSRRPAGEPSRSSARGPLVVERKIRRVSRAQTVR